MQTKQTKRQKILEKLEKELREEEEKRATLQAIASNYIIMPSQREYYLASQVNDLKKKGV